MKNHLFLERTNSNMGKIHRAQRKLFLLCACIFSIAFITHLSFGDSSGKGILKTSGVSLGMAMVTSAPSLVARPSAPSGRVAVQSHLIVPGAEKQFMTAAEVMGSNTFPLAPSFTVGVTSPAAASAVATRVYILQEQSSNLNNIVTSNGSASAITYAYNDGFAGRVISRLVSQARAGVGEVCHGVALRCSDSVTGAGRPASLGIANPYFVAWNMFNTPTPANFNITAQQTRRDQDTSIEVLRCSQNLGNFVQYSFVADANGATYGTSNLITFYLTENFSV